MSESSMKPFDFEPRTRIVFGTGSLARLGELARPLAPRRALVVSDPGVVGAGHTARAIASLEEAGFDVALFDAVHENPTTRDVDAGRREADRFQPQLLVAVGGGSSMDCAKGINFVYSNGGQMKDYWGVGKATSPMLPMIAVPTTAGTGSETQSFALISDADTHVKMACGDPKAACAVALLDPELTMTQPPTVTAVTGYDAIAHAIETFVTTRRTPLSQMWSREAWRLLAPHFEAVLSQPDDLEARAAMQLGASYAGMAIENSMLGAAHALANPLTARYGVIHGQAVALTLPAVVRFNGSVCSASYRLLATDLGLGDDSPAASVEALAGELERLRSAAGLAGRLRDVGVDESALEELAAEAARQWTGTFNPRPVDAERLLELYRQCW